jgi:hypothetical protein
MTFANRLFHIHDWQRSRSLPAPTCGAICLLSQVALQWPMPALSRKCVNDRPETWHVHYAGVRVGVIVERSGAPPGSDQWQWICGFYPGSNPGDERHGTALRRTLRQHARPSKRHGGTICQSAPMPTSRNGGMMLPGTRRNMRDWIDGDQVRVTQS